MSETARPRLGRYADTRKHVSFSPEYLLTPDVAAVDQITG
jgi:hypothetical protein